MTPIIVRFAIDRAYRRLMAASTEAEQRKWCDIMKRWIARSAG